MRRDVSNLAAVNAAPPRRVLFVGGMDRNEPALLSLGRSLGIEVEVHYGDIHGRGAAALDAMIARAELVVVVTSVNSHGGVNLAKRAARAHGVPMIIARSCGLAVARTLLTDFAADRELRAEGRKLASVA